MRKLLIIFMLLILTTPVLAQMTKEEWIQLEQMIRVNVQQENEVLRNNLNADFEEGKKEALALVDEMKGTQSKTKLVLVFVLTSAIILAETIISFLKFLVWRHKRKLAPAEPVVKGMSADKKEKPAGKLFKKAKGQQPLDDGEREELMLLKKMLKDTEKQDKVDAKENEKFINQYKVALKRIDRLDRQMKNKDDQIKLLKTKGKRSIFGLYVKEKVKR